jgi:hypothetical protein
VGIKNATFAKGGAGVQGCAGLLRIFLLLQMRKLRLRVVD